MDLAGLLLFAGVYFAAVASPGPGVAAIVARVMAQGLPGTAAFVLGFVVGDLVLFTAAALGLSALAQSFGALFAVIKYAGAAYLLFMAWKIVSAPVRDAETAAPLAAGGSLRLFASSFLLTIGNPKVIVFFVSIMPLVVDVASMTIGTFGKLALTIVLVISPVLTGYALLADRARRLFRSERARRRINYGTGAVMAGAALAVASR